MSDFKLEFSYSDIHKAAVGLRITADRLDKQSAEIVDHLADVAAVNLGYFMPKRDGNLLRSIEIRPAGLTGTGIVKDVVFGGFDRAKQVNVTAPYAAAVDSGSGVYGPKARPLKPAGNAFVMYKDPEPGRHTGKNAKPGVVFAPSIRGQRGQDFSIKAFDETAAYARARGIDLYF